MLTFRLRGKRRAGAVAFGLQGGELDPVRAASRQAKHQSKGHNVLIISLELFAGLLLFAIGSAAFWWVGQENALTPRQRDSTLLANLAVLVILGTWMGGAGFIVHSAILTYQSVVVASN